MTHLAPELKAGDVVAIMSNGGFGGIHDKILRSSRHAVARAHTGPRSELSYSRAHFIELFVTVSQIYSGTTLSRLRQETPQ